MIRKGGVEKETKDKGRTNRREGERRNGKEREHKRETLGCKYV